MFLGNVVRALSIHLCIHHRHQLNRQLNLNPHSKLVRIKKIRQQIFVACYQSLKEIVGLQDLLLAFDLAIVMQANTIKNLQL